MPLIATPDSSPLPRVASISAKMNGWTASTSRSISRAVFITSRYSANVACDLSTITWALTPSTLSRNCFWNPVVTASTTVSAATPNTTPSTDTLVNTENTENRKNAAARIMLSTRISTPTGLEPWVSPSITAPPATPPRATMPSRCISSSRRPWQMYRQPIFSSYLTSVPACLGRPTGASSAAVHHIGSQHVLDAGLDGAALVQHLVLEHQRHAPARRHVDVEVVERGLPAGEPVVEVDHERQLAALAAVALERAVVVRRESLARLVAVAPEPLVEPDRGPGAQSPGHRVADPVEQRHRERDVIEHHAAVVADVGPHREPRAGGDRRGV